jgi:2-polyprenyl-6-methoxyphenol hydroxylase-like FAD-dependent oxidoreductase
MRVVVAGGGIGGITLALALAREGIEARILEKAPALAPVGAGISVQSNAMRVLRKLGADEDVQAAGRVLEDSAILDPRGRALVRMSIAELARRIGAPVVAIHRARLHEVLVGKLAPGVLALGREVTGFTDGEGGIEAQTTGGAERGDLLVGADGLHSIVRKSIANDAPVYAGYTSWRGIATGVDVVPALATETWGRGARFGVVPIGHGEVYWFATANRPASSTTHADPAELRELFRGWHAPIPALLDATKTILRTDIHDLPTLASWHRGRAVLLGDAAHAMTPNLGQGGCQAIEDALVLASVLGRGGELDDYERLRVARANEIVVSARKLGAIAQWQNPLACRVRAWALRLTPASAMVKRAENVLKFDMPPDRAAGAHQAK